MILDSAGDGGKTSEQNDSKSSWLSMLNGFLGGLVSLLHFGIIHVSYMSGSAMYYYNSLDYLLNALSDYRF